MPAVCKRLVTVILYPGFVPTAFAAPPGLPNLGRWLNRLGWKLVRGVLDIALKKDIQRFWTDKGLPPFKHVLSDTWQSETLNLLGVSSVLESQKARKRTNLVGEEIRQENGVSQAVGFIEEMLAGQ